MISALRRFWQRTARLTALSYGSVTSALTESEPDRKSDRNVDMIIGGQAVIEGVLMRGVRGYTIAVRQPDGGVAFKRDTITPITQKYRFLRLPVLRGSVILIQSLVLGIRALNFSASASSAGEDGEPEMSNAAVIGSMVMAMVFGVGLFILAPLGVTNLVQRFWMPEMTNFVYNIIDGVVRTVIFFLYLLLISRMDDIRRVFQYHGAEHKTVFTFEARG